MAQRNVECTALIQVGGRSDVHHQGTVQWLQELSNHVGTLFPTMVGEPKDAHFLHLFGENHGWYIPGPPQLHVDQGSPTGNLCFADNIDFMVGSSSKLQSLMDKLATSTSPYGMESSTKSKVMVTRQRSEWAEYSWRRCSPGRNQFQRW